MSCPTQNQRLIAYLKKHHFITRLEATKHPLYIMNLWERCREIEKAGIYRFDRRIAYPNGKRVMQYWLRRTARGVAIREAA